MRKVFISVGIASGAYFLALLFAVYYPVSKYLFILSVALIFFAAVILLWGIVGKLVSKVRGVTSINSIQTLFIVLLSVNIYLLINKINELIESTSGTFSLSLNILGAVGMLVFLTMEKFRRLKNNP